MLNTPVAIVIAGALIAGAILTTLMVDRFAPASFTIDGKPGVFRMNLRNGTVIPCLLIPDPAPHSRDPVDQILVQCR